MFAAKTGLVVVVDEIKQFKAHEKQRKGIVGDLYLKELIFKPNGKTFKPWWTWTKRLINHWW